MDPGTAVAVGTLSAKVLSILWKYYKDVKDAQHDIKLLANELEYSHDLMQKFGTMAKGTPRLPMAASLYTTIDQALLELKTLEKKLDPGVGAKAMRRLGKRALKWPFAKGEVEQWVTRFQRLKETASLALNIDQTSLVINTNTNVTQLQHAQEATEQDRQLAKLPTAVDAAFDSYHRQHETLCIENTRVDLLQQHRDWGATHPKPLYWLSGMAGTGKSTIARTLAQHFHSTHTLGGSFFFSRSSGEANNATKFVGTFARHLANVSPQFKRLISKAIASHADVTRQGLRNQWRELILAPLSAYRSSHRPTLNFVIDALDECGSDDEIRLILQLCIEVKTVKEVDLGVFVTSRPEIAIRLGFDAIPDIIYQRLDLRDVPRQVVEQDLAVLLRRKLGRISKQQKISGWPKDEDIQSLVRLSDCLFIYAATACRYIATSDWDPKERLSEVLTAGSATGGNTAGLDSMYLQVLISSLIHGRSEAEMVKLCDRFRQVVGTIVVLFDELSAPELAELLGMSRKAIELSYASLHSVLNIPQDVGSSIRLLHPSFRDFLLDDTRCSDRHLCVNASLKHEELAKYCLKSMSDGLKRNMGHLTTPGSTPEDVDCQILKTQLPKHLQYACQYWVDHLAGISTESEVKRELPNEKDILVFFRQDFLHWLEAMSLMAKMSQAVVLITRLEDLLDSASDDTTLRSIVEDARRFILNNRGIIEKAPLQTYASALVFSPSKSLVRQHYVDQLPDWLIRSPTVEDRWGNCVQILEHDNLEDGLDGIEERSELTAPLIIPFSTDGNYIASTLKNGKIILWEAATGAVHSTLDSYLPNIVTIKFLQNGIMASMYADGSVRLFDQVTGVLFRTLEAPVEDCQLATDAHWSERPISPMFILLNGDLLVLLQNGQVWIWNWRSNSWGERDLIGTPIRRVYGCLSNGLLVAAICGNDPDSLDLSLLDTNTSQIQTIEADKIPLTMGPVAISSLDIIAWENVYGALEVVDTNDMSRTELKAYDTYSVSTSTFSPDGSMLLSSYRSMALLSWNFSTQSMSAVDRTASKIRSIAFSPDSKQLATSMGRLVKLYRFPARDMSSLRDSRAGTPLVISMASNGKQIAASLSRLASMIQIYDTQNGGLTHELSGHSLMGFVVAFSPNNQQLALTSDNSTLLVWDLRTGALDWATSGDRNQIHLVSLIFSPGGRYLVSGNKEGEILVLDAKSGNVIHVFELADEILTVQFSSDGGRIACATHRQSIRADTRGRVIGAWDIITGELIHEVDSSAINGSSYFIPIQATISPSGRYLAYSSGDGSVVIYDIESKQQRDFSIVPSDTLTSLAFSRDSKSFATCTIEKEIKQWDSETARLIGVSPINALGKRLSFTENENFLEFENGHIPIYPIEGNLSIRPSRHLSHWWYDRDTSWFMENTRKMLWIPPAYRPEKYGYLVHHDGLFAFSNDKGIHYFKFNQGEEISDPNEHDGNQ
ncbi:MAG: hypothetical protein Q9180_003421 [Flavoplaca navasiana]